MADRNQVKIIIYVLKNAPHRILTYLESRILKIGPLVQKLQILQVVGTKAIFKISTHVVTFELVDRFSKFDFLNSLESGEEHFSAHR